jgi:hypothetical protein
LAIDAKTRGIAHLVAKALADNQAITAINILALEQLAKELAMGGAQTPQSRCAT